MDTKYQEILTKYRFPEQHQEEILTTSHYPACHRLQEHGAPPTQPASSRIAASILAPWEPVDEPSQHAAEENGAHASFADVAKSPAAVKESSSRFKPGRPADLGPLFMKAKAAAAEGMPHDALGSTEARAHAQQKPAEAAPASYARLPPTVGYVSER